MPVQHTIQRAVTINGVVYYFTSVRPAQHHKRQGTLLEADDGGATLVTTGTKRRYVYALEKSTPALFAALLALPASFSVTDHNNEAWTACCALGSPSWTVSHGDASSTAGTEYQIDVEIWEA